MTNISNRPQECNNEDDLLKEKRNEETKMVRKQSVNAKVKLEHTQKSA